jgi:hypothetical protein
MGTPQSYLNEIMENKRIQQRSKNRILEKDQSCPRDTPPMHKLVPKSTVHSHHMPEYLNQGKTDLSDPNFKDVNDINEVFKDAYPKTIVAPFKFSDSSPFESNIKTFHNEIVRQRKLLISDLKKKFSTDSPENFTVDIPTNFRNIRSVRLLQVGITWTPPASNVPRDAYVYFPDFDHCETTADGRKYHGYFPLVQGDAGTPVLFNFNFNNNYESDFTQLNELFTKLKVEVYKEDPATTEWILFSELNRFIVEIQINYIDEAAPKDKGVGK